jgi:hypothetical protein
VFILSWATFLGSISAAGMLALDLKVLAAAFFRLVSIPAAYGAAMSFCFLYPHVRASIRKSAMRQPLPVPEAPPASAAG